jgi:hypothetical protein
MIGTITKRARRDGKPASGYSFFAGRSATGKRIQITKSGFDSRKAAADALRKAIEQYRSEAGRASPIRFTAFLDRWLDEYASHRCTPKTLERYRQLGQHAKKYLGDTQLEFLASVAIERMLNNLLDSGGPKDQAHRTVDNSLPERRVTSRSSYMIHSSPP